MLQFLGRMFRGGLVIVFLLGAGWLGWATVRGWLLSQQSVPSSPAATTTPEPNGLSAQERERKAELLGRIAQSPVPSNFFYRLANEAYYLKYPDQQGRLLSQGPEDAPLRANWDAQAH